MKAFAVKVEDGKKGEDGKPSVGPIYRNLLSKGRFPPPDPNLSTCWDLFRLTVEKYPDNRMLGWRIFVDGKVGPYVWKTYKEVYGEVLNIGSALRASGAEPGTKIGIYGANCPEWIVAMEACNAHGLVCVPLYDTLGPGAVDFIIDNAEIDFVFVQDKKLKELLNPGCKSVQRLKSIICFSSLTEEQKNNGADYGFKLYNWDEFLALGIKNPSELSPPRGTDTCTIMYTSGTSGDPKGVVITHETVATSVIGIDLFLEQFEDKMTVEDVYISFLPLTHILDRAIEEFFFHRGASVGFYHGDLNGLREDLMELMPTFLAGVPRVFERIHDGIKTALEELNPRRRRIFDRNPKLTEQSMQGGWFHTGDIGEMQPNGVVKIIDRKKNLIKLSQGEYVALEYLENVYGTTPIVEDIWVYGSSFKSAVVAVVVPHEENTKTWAQNNGHKGSLSELCCLEQLRSYVLSELKLTAERNKLRGFEDGKGIILEPNLLDMERDFVTATMKKKRNVLLKER